MTQEDATDQKRNDELLAALGELGGQLRKVDEQRAELLLLRQALVTEARERGITWRALAATLGMTEQGVIKASRRSP